MVITLEYSPYPSLGFFSLSLSYLALKVHCFWNHSVRPLLCFWKCENLRHCNRIQLNFHVTQISDIYSPCLDFSAVKTVMNLPARIAFPGWVSLAFPAGAAADRHLGLRKELAKEPLSCITTRKTDSKTPGKKASSLSFSLQVGGFLCFLRATHETAAVSCAFLDAGELRRGLRRVHGVDSGRTLRLSRKLGCATSNSCYL